MKKILLTLSACIAMTLSGSAQVVIMSETFGSPTVAPALPASWSQHSTGTTAWHTGRGGSGNGSTWGSLTGANNVPTTHGQYVIVDDAAHPTQLHDTLKSPVFNMTGYTPANVYMAYDYFFYNATNNSSGKTETCYIIGSSDGGSTWAIIDSVYGNGWYVDAFSTAYTSLSSLSGANCQIGFVYSDNAGAILGCALNNVSVSVPPAGDITLTAVTPPATPAALYQTGATATLGGTISNMGSTTITSFVAGYQVGAGTPVSTTISGVSVAPFTTYNFSITTPYTVLSGSHNATVWVNEPGGTAPTPADTMTTVIIGVDSLQPKTVMIEEFNQASCDPCAEATPNLDSVYVNNLSNSIMVRYHVNFPGRDCMDSVTLAPFVSSMLSYYNVNGVPDAQVDGSYVYPGYAPGSVYMNSALLQGEAAQGSPFKIVVTPAYDATTNTYSFSANIKSYAPMPAGLVVRAALTVDTITYLANQSTESIPQTSFPEVAENMFPGPGGTALTSFTSGSTQTISGSWVKNHPWGSNRSVWGYDSTPGCHIVVWVMDNSTQYVYQAAKGVVAATCIPPITGTNNICAGTSTALSNTATGGAWSSSNTGVATVDASTGVVYGTVPGNTEISYLQGSCTVSTFVSVVAAGSAGTIMGSDTVCVGGSGSTLTDTVSGGGGGVWSSTNAGIARVSGTGVVTAVSAGTSTIVYSVSNACGIYTATATVTVPTGTAGTISGNNTVCLGGFTTSNLTDGVSGGTWTSTNAAVATVSGSGVVSALSAGTATIEYVVVNAPCVYTATKTITVFSAANCPLAVNPVNSVSTELQVFPNPNSGVFTMNLSSNIDEEVHVSVTNIMGQTVSDFTTLTNKTTDINLATAAPGIYLLSASTIHGRNVTKVVIH